MNSERPLAITIVIVVTFLGSLIALPAAFSEMSRQVAYWYSYYIVTATICLIASLVGLWMMKRWGLFMYSGVIVVNQIIAIYMLGFITSIFLASLILPITVVGLGGYYYNTMD